MSYDDPLTVVITFITVEIMSNGNMWMPTMINVIPVIIIRHEFYSHHMTSFGRTGNTRKYYAVNVYTRT